MHLSNDPERTPGVDPQLSLTAQLSPVSQFLYRCHLRWSRKDLQGNVMAGSREVGREGTKEGKVTLTSIFTELSEKC